MLTLTTKAWIGSGASVNAKDDIAVLANARSTVVSVVAGVGVGTVGVAGSVSVTVLHEHTFACTGGALIADDSGCTGSGASLNADGNVLVGANDDTRLVLVTAAIACGYVGVGAAVGVAAMDKETRAFLGGGSVVNALGTGNDLTGVSNGTVSSSGFGSLGAFRGLAVQATASEDVFGLTPAVGACFVGVAGGVAVTRRATQASAFGFNSSTPRRSGGAEYFVSVFLLWTV